MKLRFTIRDLLWLVVVVALAVGWWIDHREAQKQQHTLMQRIEDLSAEIQTSTAQSQGVRADAWHSP